MNNLPEPTTELARRAKLIERALVLAEEALITTSNPGICISCGHEQDGCEPDARNYECDNCGSLTVFGAEEAVLRLI